MRVDIVDLTSRSIPYDVALTSALVEHGCDARLITAGIPAYLDSFDGAVPHTKVFDASGVARRLPGLLSDVVRGVECTVNWLQISSESRLKRTSIVHLQWLPLAQRGYRVENRSIRKIRSFGVPVVLTVHNVLPHGASKRHAEIFGYLYRLADALICHTESSRKILIEEFDIEPDRVHVIPHGPLESGKSAISREEARSQLGLDANEFVGFVFGRIRPSKNIELLIQAWPQVAGCIGRSRLIIAGNGSGQYLRVLKNLSSSSPAASSIQTRFYDIPEDELTQLIAAADAVFFPYREITQSGALLAAMAAGKVVIASDLEAFRETIHSEETGYLVTAEDPKEWSRQIIRVARDESSARVVGQNARSFVKSQLGWSKIATKTAELYELVSTR